MEWLKTHLVFSIGDDFTKIPVEKGMYRMFDKEGNLLYIGIARDLRGRIRCHFSGKTNTKSYYTDFDKCLITFFEEKYLEMREIERAMINILKPKYNKALYPNSKLFKTTSQQQNH